MIVILDSVRLSIFITIKAQAQRHEDKTTSNCPLLTVSKPGRSKTKVPQNPKKIAHHLRKPTTSLRTTIANTVAKIGAVTKEPLLQLTA